MEKKIEIIEEKFIGKSHVYEGDINIEEVVKLIDALDDGANVVYLCSEGGDTSYIPVILDLFNKHNVILKAYDRVVSAAFDIYAKYIGEKHLLQDCFGGIHLATSDLDWRSSLNKGNDVGYYKNIYLMRHDSLAKSGAEYLEELASYGIPEEVIAQVMAGEDVYISYEEMLKLNFGGKNG